MVDSSGVCDSSGASVAARGIVDEIGNTPLLRLANADVPAAVSVYAKLEFFNPGGSVKDRPARRMILEGIASGDLGPGKVILDSTSGNTGIAYAMVGAALGYPVRLAMPASVTHERKAILAAYGADVVLTDPGEGSDGAILEARRILQEDPDLYFKPDQYNNPANWWAHRDTTAREIWSQTGGKVTHLVATMGTSGTVMGTGQGLRGYRSDVVVVGAEPDDAFHGIEGLKHMASSIVPGIYDAAQLDDKIGVSTEAAYDATVHLARDYGILVGQSSGAAYLAACQVGQRLREGTVVTVFCDGGDKYMTTPMWRLALEESGLIGPATPDAEERA
ncbi:MAG TPA: cysteine synthase family protein [Candidatus Latescibacteria bacterium]|nr:cysteine synthase family protein [Candidatus Latescibacterota bacterium]HJP28958.1 cysteine synthase family protein [Candidatus Latescibacterota bacterium]